MDLNQVTLPSRDLSKSVQFYRKLGLTLIVDSIPRYARLECARGNSTLSVHYVDALPTGVGVTLYFECENLDEEVARLAAAGVSFDEMPTDRRWLWREATLKDPDGNRLILYHAGTNRKDPPWKVPAPVHS